MGQLLKITRIGGTGIWFFCVAAVVSILSLFRPFNFRNGARFRRWVFPFGRKLLGVKLVVRHRERLKSKETCIFIANHQHTLDMFVFANVLPDRTLTVGKKQLAWIPFFGWVYALGGNLLIDREDHMRAMGTMEKARAEVEKGLSIFLLPEGTRSRGKGLGPFKKGAFHLAIDCQAPLHPIVASSYHKSVDFGRKQAGKVLVDILEPIPTRGKTAADVEALMAEAHAKMQAALEKLDAELEISDPCRAAD